MNLSGLTDKHKERLLDLLILGMYADAHLARSEEARIQKLLDALNFSSPDARNRFADAGITRARNVISSPASVNSAISDMAKEFATPEIRKRATDALELLLFSDSKMLDREREFLANVKKTFGC